MHPLSLLELRRVTKRFGPHTVLRDVSLDVRRGETHVLAGENGAGKSTLIKILAGVYSDYEGVVLLEGRERRFASPLEASDAGIAVIHQELSGVETLSVAENLFLGRERRGLWARTDHRRARELCREVGLDVDVRRPWGELSIGARSLVEIAKALACDARLLILDEPTSALGAREAESLFALLGRLKARGCGLVYISHKMDEIDRLADRITVLRDGRHVVTAVGLTRAELVRHMVGRELGEQFPTRAGPVGDIRFEVAGLGAAPGATDVGGEELGARATAAGALQVRAGEILGIGGLQGCGASELLEGIFIGAAGVGAAKVGVGLGAAGTGAAAGAAGALARARGRQNVALGAVGAGGVAREGDKVSYSREGLAWRLAGLRAKSWPFGEAPRSDAPPGPRVLLDGKPFASRGPADSIRQGVALLTSDRKATGLVLSLGIRENMALASRRGVWIRGAREQVSAQRHRERLGLKARTLEQEVGELSGGNQQKVVLAKWLETRPRVLLLDEPTRGVDVGAKREIYALVRELAAQGTAIVLVSTEMSELLGLADRVAVMRAGRVVAQYAAVAATQERVLEAALGGAPAGITPDEGARAGVSAPECRSQRSWTALTPSQHPSAPAGAAFAPSPPDESPAALAVLPSNTPQGNTEGAPQ